MGNLCSEKNVSTKLEGRLDFESKGWGASLKACCAILWSSPSCSASHFYKQDFGDWGML